ncbi:unnamed protein product [Calypogeia fissa]
MATSSYQLKCRQTVGSLLLLMCFVSHYAAARPSFLLTPLDEQPKDQTPELDLEPGASRSLKFLVPSPSLVLNYHNGPILSAATGIPVYLIWYGTFSVAQKSIVTDFFASFSSEETGPSVGSWWNLTSGYKNSAGGSVSSKIFLAGEMAVSYTTGTTLTETDVQTLVVNSLATFPSDANGIYLVLTASDVMVQDFCMNSCGSHFATLPSGVTNEHQLPYAWVGNPAGSTECLGLCAWPFANPTYGPQGTPLVAPNGDVGMDGMVINLAVILAGTATDPFNTGFYQGDASAPLESASACAGIFGAGSYPGYPGDLLVDPATGASYNVNGNNGRKFLMPALWDPSKLACVAPY